MRRIGTLYILIVMMGAWSFSQTATDHKVLVELYPLGLPPLEISVILRDTVAYVPMRETFNYLGIKGDYSPQNGQLTGFFKTPDTSYTVEFQKGRARIDGRSLVVSSDDYILQADTLYLRTGFLNDLFGLDFKYNPRRVRIELKKSRSLPAVLAILRHRRFQALEARQLAVPSPDFYFGREATALGAGRFDWRFNTAFTGSRFLGTRYGLTLGLQALYGDFTANEIGFIDHGRNENTFRGQYRLPFLDNDALQQIIVGDYLTSGIQIRLVRGVEVTNRPVTQRFNFTREVFHGQFDPHVDIDLLGTAMLPQYQQSNDLGMYSFDVPVIYGQGIVQIDAYDPWGGVQQLYYRMNVPRDMVPEGQFEYSITGAKTRGTPEYYTSSDYLKWGVSSDLTMGMKLEYFDLENSHQKFFPALTATSRLGRSIYLTGSVAPQALSQANLSWLFFKSADLEVTGTQYAQNTFFNPARISNEIFTTVNVPFMLSTVPVGIGLSGDQTLYNGFTTKNIQTSISFAFQRIAPRLSTLTAWTSTQGGSTMTTRRVYELSAAMYLPAGVIVEPDLTYNQLADNLESILVTVAKSIGQNFRAYLLYGRFPQLNSYNIGLNIAYYFPFFRAQVGATESQGGTIQYSSFESGSVGFDPRTRNIYFLNSPTFAGFGGVVVHPYFDANNNGIQDNGEQSIDAARMYYSNMTRNTPFISLAANRLTLDRLPQYEDFQLYVDQRSLDNPVWVPRFTSFKMLSEPNYIKTVDIPIVTGGTISGSVRIVREKSQVAAEEINIKLTSLSPVAKGGTVFTKSMSTFSTGEYEFTPLPPGKYRIELDATQLQTLGFTCDKPSIEVELQPKPEGDVVSNVDFALRPR